MRRLAIPLLALFFALPALAAAPAFEHTPPPDAVPGQDLTVAAAIHSSGGVYDPYLWYRPAGSKGFRKLALKRGADGRYLATIPGAEVAGDVEYFLQAFDASNLAEGTWSSRKRPYLLRARQPLKPGMLTIRADPDGATVEIDGSVVGKSPWTGAIAPGAHALIVTKEGYEPLRMSFTMAAGADIALPAPLRKLVVAAPPPAPPPKDAPARTREGQWVDFVTAQTGEQFGVEARGAEGIAHCSSSVEVGLSCRLKLAPGPTHVVISRGMQLTRDLVVPPGRSEVRLARGTGPLPLVAGVVLAGAGVGSYFYFKHRADTSTPVEKLAAWQYAVSGGGVAAGLGLFLYGILSTDSLDLKPLAESAPLRVGVGPVQGGVAAAATALF